MNERELIAIVEDYFAAVDAKDLDGTLSFLTADCVFMIETFEVVHSGRDEKIRGMFERLFANWDSVWHGYFRHTADIRRDQIASQFEVRNTAFDGTVHNKHNCNFFQMKDGLIHRVSVYMSGDNTLS